MLAYPGWITLTVRPGFSRGLHRIEPGDVGIALGTCKVLSHEETCVVMRGYVGWHLTDAFKKL